MLQVPDAEDWKKDEEELAMNITKKAGTYLFCLAMGVEFRSFQTCTCLFGELAGVID